MDNTDAHPVSVQASFSLPFPLYIKGSYEVRLGDVSVNVVIEHIRQETIDPRLGIAEGSFDLETDRTGLAGYARLLITADWASFERLCAKTGNVGPRDFAQFVANKVIDSHRHATRTPWIRRVKQDELFQLDYCITLSNNLVQKETDILSLPSGITLPRSITEGNKEFVQRLVSDTPVAMWDTLWLDSEDAMARGDFRSAVISGHSAIETLANATVLAWARGKDLSVQQAALELGRNNDEKRSLRNSLSVDELVEFLNDTRKVEIALLDVCGADQSWGFDYYSRFERLAADRNKALHAGLVVEERYARDHIEVVRAIRQQLIAATNIERIRNLHSTVSVVNTLTELLERELNPELSRLVRQIEEKGTAITLWSMRRYPMSFNRADNKAALVWNESRLDIYLRRTKAKIDEDAEKELTRMLLKHSLFQEGWPYAVVIERDTSGGLTLIPFNWEAFRIIAGCVTDAILGSTEIDRRLREAGFNTQKEIEIGSTNLQAQVTAPGFKVPEWRDIDYYRLPICVSLMELLGIERDWHLPPTLETKASGITQKLQGLIRRCRILRWEPSRTAATLMLAILSELGLSDNIGVWEEPNRNIRTRFTDEELGVLKDLEQAQSECQEKTGK